MSAWTDLVKKVYDENKEKSGYRLGDAMKAAKKLYKKVKTMSSSKKTKKGITRKNKKDL
jgi:hypothetical protein